MKSIRTIILFVAVLLCGIDSDAQGVRVYKSNGITIDIPYAELDSIVNVPGREFVDMGLSVKWATCNIGAERPDEYGDFFAWGEIQPKTSYNNPDKAPDVILGDISGDIEYDAARANWGAPARMPTNWEINELCEKCNWQRVMYNDVFGMLVTGPNGKSIFLPAAGFCVGSSFFSDGSDGYYWSSTPLETNEDDAYYLDFDKKFYYWGNWLRRYLGQPVRAVADYGSEA